MLIRQAMTKNAEYIHSSTSLKDAARKMVELDCGFLPIGDSPEGKLKGVITDRDIAVRAVAEGLDPNKTTVADVKTDKVLYCYEGDNVKTAADSMHDQHVYRLIVLNNRDDKKLSGIISLGDIVRQDEEQLAGKTVKGITSKAA